MNYDQSTMLNHEPGQMAISDKDKVVAGILGIVVGGLGIHRMYMGYIGLGILQLILTILTFGLAGLWGFIEGILILAQDSWTDSQGRLLKGNEKGPGVYYQGVPDELNTPAGSSNKYRKLNELNELKEKGVITQQEFDIEKRKIL